MPKGHANFRLGDSVRSYRRWLEQIMRDAYNGSRPMADLNAAAGAAKAASELFMAEKMLQRSGGDTMDQDHPHGDMGGFDGGDGRVYRKKTITVETGQSAQGPVDRKKVSYEGSSQDESLESDAEIEGLS